MSFFRQLRHSSKTVTTPRLPSILWIWVLLTPGQDAFMFSFLSVTWLVFWKAIQNKTQISLRKLYDTRRMMLGKNIEMCLQKHSSLPVWLWPWKHTDAKPCDFAAFSFKPFLFDLLVVESERLFSLFKTQGPCLINDSNDRETEWILCHYYEQNQSFKDLLFFLIKS